ncbi:DNA-directed RNA polymerase subunit beta [Paenibacillus phoenicis]|uniref:DNA-directed RNA polymerase subunit beta n=1 Tax=Paenibacillus phoenicis TaxID=554117 RepID=A0ABU5PN66_9BACL|nr:MULTISPECIES: DNA-directed RNA polymerase subunit beta [Paenibacillus]MEA3571389.1 DNA-directed RNA polymerase subunit beta [Paenibacillus phoenicis]
MSEDSQPVSKRPAWIVILKIVLVLLVLVAALAAGMVVGYVVFGKQDMSDIWNWATWKHVLDLVFAP